MRSTRSPPRDGTPAAGEPHRSGFLESGHTRNSSSAGSKARGGSRVRSLCSGDGRDTDACTHLWATAGGRARVPRSAEASRPQTPRGMAWQPATGPLRARDRARDHPRRRRRCPGVQPPRPGPAPRCSGNAAPDRWRLALWFRGRPGPDCFRRDTAR